MKQQQEAEEQAIVHFMQFLEASPTAWHCVAQMSKYLHESGFEELQEDSQWQLKAGGRYFVMRNGSTFCAFIVPQEPIRTARIVAAHTDSPSLKLKPNSEFRKENMTMLGVEVYGSPLLSSWLNRDLAIAGRVVYSDENDEVKESVITLKERPVVIPQLAIHLDRQVNDTGLTLNKQEHLSALAALDWPAERGSYLEDCLKQVISFKKILGHDLFLVPMEPPRLIGYKKQMISAYRLDNLASVHAALTMLNVSEQPQDHLKLFVAWDNEEIGSETAQGAASPFLPHLLERICLSCGVNREGYLRLLTNSVCISADLAHATHPNYSDRHDSRHTIQMQKGIVLKSHAQQRYATNARSASLVTGLCHDTNIPFQWFVPRGDIPSGSTIGPIHAANAGMDTVDIGIAQLSMHSSRELIACRDHHHLCELFGNFWYQRH